VDYSEYYLIYANHVNRVAPLASPFIIGIMSTCLFVQTIEHPTHFGRTNQMASTEERVKDIVIKLLGVDAERVVPEARFREDLEADSLDLVELIMAFEEEFGGEITDEDAQSITTVGQAVSYIDTHMS
jgi:acyl carrier protein